MTIKGIAPPPTIGGTPEAETISAPDHRRAFLAARRQALRDETAAFNKEYRALKAMPNLDPHIEAQADELAGRLLDQWAGLEADEIDA